MKENSLSRLRWINPIDEIIGAIKHGVDLYAGWELNNELINEVADLKYKLCEVIAQRNHAARVIETLKERIKEHNDKVAAIQAQLDKYDNIIIPDLRRGGSEARFNEAVTEEVSKIKQVYIDNQKVLEGQIKELTDTLAKYPPILPPEAYSTPCVVIVGRNSEPDLDAFIPDDGVIHDIRYQGDDDGYLASLNACALDDSDDSYIIHELDVALNKMRIAMYRRYPVTVLDSVWSLLVQRKHTVMTVTSMQALPHRVPTDLPLPTYTYTNGVLQQT